MSNKQQYDGNEVEYAVNGFREFERFNSASKRQPTMGRKRGKAPQSFNGMHRRRKRKMAW